MQEPSTTKKTRGALQHVTMAEKYYDYATSTQNGCLLIFVLLISLCCLQVGYVRQLWILCSGEILV